MSYLTKKQLIELMAELPDDTPILFEYRGSDFSGEVVASNASIFHCYERRHVSGSDELTPNIPNVFTAVCIGYSSEYN